MKPVKCVVGLSLMVLVEMAFLMEITLIWLVFDLMVRRCFHLMSVFILNKVAVTGLQNVLFP